MKVWLPRFLPTSILFILVSSVSVAHATDNSSATSIPKDETQTQESTSHAMSKEELHAYLKQNPQELEKLLTQMIQKQNADALAELLPIYSEYAMRDESMIEWGNAIIAMSKGDIQQSIKLYRKVNAVLPNIKLLRFQLAQALFQDKQYKAAKNELEKLRSSYTAQADIDQINQFIQAIDHQNSWNFNVNAYFINDNNLTNASPKGTSYNGLVNNQSHQEGKGIGYGLSADKKWSLDDRFFTSAKFNLYGKNYWDNKKFNEANANVGAGIGYQNATSEIELYPSFTQGWYGGGTSGDGDLEKYSKNSALNLSVSHWFDPKLLYQNFSQYGKIRYEEPFDSNDINTRIFSNTLVYLPKQTRSFYAGLDLINGDNSKGYDYNSYDKKGVRLGWSEAWNHGISTRVNLGFGKKDFDGQQFLTNIERKDKEYDLGLSIWKRDFTIFKLTPRLSWNYHKVTSNSPFDEYSKNNVNFELTQTF
ncbi:MULTISPECIES: surface lipoprotein assembly modifier [unclassified Moraxella]|uniref:surface lipoprotein assembly modifier n=1 Tax=unclassified Moraxella TaxID=2685852 RepID=UPI003AF87138